MATERNYEETPTPRRPPLPARVLGYVQSLLMIAVCLLIAAVFGVALFLSWPNLVAQYQQRFLGAAAPAEQATPVPTLAPAARQQLQQAAPNTASEQQAIQQARPVENVATPPALPAESTAAAIQQPSALDDAPARSLSPQDLTYRPLPTPTTMLSQAEFDASQASEEQNFINGQLQGLTPAQQMVQVHQAEQQAQP